MLIDSPDPAMRISRGLITGVSASLLVAALFLATLVARARRAQVLTGSQGLVGERGVARSALHPQGKVFVHGEIWSAVADGEAAPGDPVEVLAVDGLTLRVRPLRAAP